jgi:hypothetical protein
LSDEELEDLKDEKGDLPDYFDKAKLSNLLLTKIVCTPEDNDVLTKPPRVPAQLFKQ